MLGLLLDWILILVATLGGVFAGIALGIFIVVPILMIFGWFLMLLGAAVVAGSAETDEALGMLDMIRGVVLERWG